MKPSKYNEVQSIMDTLLYRTIYSKNLVKPSIAFTHSRTNTLCGTIYTIYLNNSDKELKDYLYMHECGHIIFSHVRNMDMRADRFLNSKLQASYSRIAKFFNNNTTDFEIFKNMLFNIVMDFEVNSRLFTQSEWDFMNERVSILTNNPGSKGMWPGDYGFPSGLTWNEYLNLILMNPEDFFTQIRKLIKNRVNKFKMENPSHITQSEYEEHLEEMKNKKLDDSEMEELKKLSQDHENATFEVPNGLMEGRTTGSYKPVHIDFKICSSYDEMLNQIIKELKINDNSFVTRDILYNSNRRKFNTNIIIPKELHKTVSIPARKLYLLFDVSGSVDAKMIFDFISTFSKIKNHFRNVQIITWNTQLVREWNINDQIQNLYGGGTNIAYGIKYVNRKYNLKNKDVLFVISDFQDNLNAWEKELTPIKANKYAINWNFRKKCMNPGFKKVFIKEN